MMKAKFIFEVMGVDKMDELEYKARLYDEIKNGMDQFYDTTDSGQTILARGSFKEVGEWVAAKLGFKSGF